MKRIVLAIALVLSMAILIACAGPTPRPVIIQGDKEVQQTKP